MKEKSVNNISAEMVAAFLDGNAVAWEEQNILNALSKDAELRELLHISQSVDAELGMISQECDFIPMTAMAATCNEENYCCLECEKYILECLDIEFDEQQLLQNAVQKGWQKEEGTALHNVGRHLEEKGLVVTRRYKCTVEDVANALAAGENVIVAVDGGELLGDRVEEVNEDIFIGQIPDHTVVVLSCDMEKDLVTVYDPNSQFTQDTYPVDVFLDAWNDSENYMVKISLPDDIQTYVPRPIDLSDVQLPEELMTLREAIAENVHEVWAAERRAQGWTYGVQRDDAKKQTPCLVPYSRLSDNEKVFDRNTAMDTLKLVKKLGYDIVKRKK